MTLLERIVHLDLDGSIHRFQDIVLNMWIHHQQIPLKEFDQDITYQQGRISTSFLIGFLFAPTKLTFHLPFIFAILRGYLSTTWT